MKFNKQIVLLVLLVMVSGLLTGCLDTKNDPPKTYPNYVTDDTGEEVGIPEKSENIISLAPSVTEILFSLGKGDKIVGRDSGSNYPEGANNIEIVSTYEGIDIEKILSKEPDIIIMDKTLDLSEDNYNKILEFDLNVFRVYPTDLEDILDNIIQIGKLTKTDSKAQELVTSLESRINNIETLGQSIPKPNQLVILHIIYYDGASSPWVATSSTFSGDLIDRAGAEAAVQDGQGKSIQISVEKIYELDPDMIFTSQDDTWPTPSRESILNDEKFDNLKAVKNNMVIDVNSDLVDRPGPRLVDGLELISGYISN